MKTKFEEILARYNLPKEVNWDALWISIDRRRNEDGMRKNHQMGEDVQVWDIDAEELIRLIMLLETNNHVLVQGASSSISLVDKALHKYLILSLHKLLQLKWGLENPSKEDLKCGKVGIIAEGAEDFVFVSNRKAFSRKEPFFIQPYDEEDLEKLLVLSKRLKECHQLKQGRGKDISFLGESVALIQASIPNEVKEGLSKTDLLNFVGEVMDMAGLMDNVPKWKALSNELAMREKNGWVLGDIRKERQKMLANWVRRAKEVYSKIQSIDKCKGCKEYEGCIVPNRLKDFDI